MGTVRDLEPGTTLTSPDALWDLLVSSPFPLAVPLPVHELPISLSCTEGEGSQGGETPVGSGGSGEGVPQEH